MIAAVVAVLGILLYVWDRNSKGQAIDWMDAGKIGVGTGGVAAGIAYAVGGDEVAEAVSTVADKAQEMFVGKPEF